MSIANCFALLAAAATEPTTQPATSLAGLLIYAGCAFGLVVAWQVGVFRRGSINGPPRSTSAPSPLTLFAVALAGFVAAIVFVSLFEAIALPLRTPVPSTADSRTLVNPRSTTRLSTRTTTAPLLTTTTTEVDDDDPLSKLAPRPRAIVELGNVFSELLAMLVLLMLVPGRPLTHLGLTRANFPRAFPIGFIGSIVAVPWTFLATGLSIYVFVTLGHAAPEHPILKQLQSTADPSVQWLLALTAIVFAPAAEEILFRACLQTALRQIIGRPWPAILITSALFALMHPAPWMYFPLMFLAICLGYIYQRTNNLWASIIVHATFNAISTALALSQ